MLFWREKKFLRKKGNSSMCVIFSDPNLRRKKKSSDTIAINAYIYLILIQTYSNR